MLRTIAVFLLGAISTPALLAIVLVGIYLFDPPTKARPLLAASEIGCPDGLVEDMSVGYCVPELRISNGSYSNTAKAPIKDPELRRIQIEALKGDRTAQRDLGFAYRQGIKIKHNGALSFYWLRQSALHGDKGAQYSVGVLLSNGTGVKENDIEAMRWLKLAAIRGLKKAQAIYGEQLLTGKGVKKDRKEGLIWLKRSLSNMPKKSPTPKNTRA